MDINTDLVLQNYNKAVFSKETNKLKQAEGLKQADDDNLLQKLADEFVSILIKEMLKSMRNTVPENGLMNGGFAEDVFTDMLDEEYSKNSVKQAAFSSLGRILYEQLKQQEQ
ncbi:MAG: hypothetical protein GX175_02345 [Halanaerobiaceae bacterium]|nr:hypothetical protein [Halanaerobiaceae bacterium]